MKRLSSLLVLVVLPLLTALSVHAQTVVEHPPWLNWDILNNTGAAANDFEIVVESPNYTVNAGDPSQLIIGPPFDTFGLIYGTDPDGDGDNDTVLTWQGGDVAPGAPVHIGALMTDSGPIVDAYWTNNGQRVGIAPPVVMETTRILFGQGLPQITMRLAMPTSFFDEVPGGSTVEMTGIRTFTDIPAGVLALGDINETLDLNSLLPFENLSPDGPRLGTASGPLITPSTVLSFPPSGPDSFFDIWLDTTLTPGPQFESLLYAELNLIVAGEPNPIPVDVRFWNLNTQCPEPATLALAGLATLLLWRRRH